METIQNPDKKRKDSWRRMARDIRWIEEDKRANDESGVKLNKLLARRIGVQWSCDNGLLNLWKCKAYYYGSVQQWGAVTMLVKTKDFEKVLLWKHFKLNELR
jgi:hypothetical protein